MKTHLERMCNTIDEVLNGHGFCARVAGGYVAGNGILFSLTDTEFLNTQVRFDLKEALRVSRVMATVGVVLVNDRKLRRRPVERVIDEAQALLPAGPPEPAKSAETVDLLDLIAAHEADVARGATAVSNQKEAVPHTRPLDSGDVGPASKEI